MNKITRLQQIYNENLIISLETLKEGKELLKQIQTRLKSLSMYAGKIDGLYGRHTEAGLIEFCNLAHLDNMKTQQFGRTFAEKLIEFKPPSILRGQVTGKFISPTKGPITSKFGWRIHPLTGRRTLHKGIDIGGPVGRPVVASDGGNITIAGVVSGYGNFVAIRHANGLTSRYAHLDRIDVELEQSVRQAQRIGLMGKTGNVTGPHLHFEIFRNSVPKNPRDFINF